MKPTEDELKSMGKNIFCSDCGRKLILTKHKWGYSEEDGKPLFIFEYHCPSLFGRFHSAWRVQHTANGCIASKIYSYD